jgi:RNA polymerase sporulation-specific sigma factor
VTPHPIAWTAEHEEIAQMAAAGYYYPGGDHDDVVQEARIGVWHATQTHRPDGLAFRRFAFGCARRRVITALKAATRRKHRVLTMAVSFDAPINPGRDEDDGTVGDQLAAPMSDPAEITLAAREAREMLARFALLSPFERECVQRVMIEGAHYDEVGPPKSVDNALQRAKVKLAGADTSRERSLEPGMHVVFVDRTVHQTEQQAAAAAREVIDGTIISLAKRKLHHATTSNPMVAHGGETPDG